MGWDRPTAWNNCHHFIPHITIIIIEVQAHFFTCQLACVYVSLSFSLCVRMIRQCASFVLTLDLQFFVDNAHFHSCLIIRFIAITIRFESFNWMGFVFKWARATTHTLTVAHEMGPQCCWLHFGGLWLWNKRIYVLECLSHLFIEIIKIKRMLPLIFCVRTNTHDVQMLMNDWCKSKREHSNAVCYAQFHKHTQAIERFGWSIGKNSSKFFFVHICYLWDSVLKFVLRNISDLPFFWRENRIQVELSW